MPLAFTLVAALAVGNLAVSSLARRAQDPRQLGRAGMWAFSLDVVAVLGLAWVARGTGGDAWVVVYVLPLEGAIRYGVPGALAPVAATLLSESLREASFADGHPFRAAVVAFRVGIQLTIAVVAGLMARSMRREAERARERARLAEESAALASSAAEREAQARRELSAFHSAILAGLAVEDPDEGLQAMVEAVGRELRCKAFGVLLREEDEDGRPELVAKGVYGSPGYARGDRFGAGSAIGDAALEGRPVMHKDPPEGIVPLRAGGDSIGLLHEVASSPEAMDRERLLVLGRLADQIALVAQAARLRARQEETLRRLKELDEMKSDFIAITSHEL
ncbi:MAG: GAF domain-containing protein, partial [Actinobacteria bacterium]|nr:GAF domain-containing protein [Actinomycetota bacterium]